MKTYKPEHGIIIIELDNLLNKRFRWHADACWIVDDELYFTFLGRKYPPLRIADVILIKGSHSLFSFLDDED